MSKYTPGPWRVDENYVVSELGADSGDGLRACDVHSWTIAEIPDCSAAVDEIGLVELGQGVKEANARLIASAPDLLEALEQSFDFPADFFECEETDAVTITVTGRHLSMVKAAIAKARGES